MNRLRLTIAVPVVAFALVGAGCTTFSDQDAIARVGDVELDDATLDEILPLVGAGVPADQQADATRAAISVWLEAQVFTQAIESADIELMPESLDLTVEQLSAQFPDAFPALSDDTRDLLVDYVTGLDQLQELPRPSTTEVARWFNGGTETSGIACVSHILVETEDEAEEVVDQLRDADDEGGDAAEFEAFATLAEERSSDPGSAAAGGFLTCDLGDTMAQQFVEPFAAGIAEARPGVPTEPIESDFGFHVIRLQTYDESTEQLEPFFESGFVQARMLIDDADVHVDSRYGFADGVNVLPLT